MPRSLFLAFTALLLATSSALAAPPQPDPVAMFTAFADALNARDLDRAHALLADNAIVADEHGEYVGDDAREWLVRTGNEGIHISFLSLARMDTDERPTPGDTTSWFSFSVALSSDLDRKLGHEPQTRAGSAIVTGSVIHSFRLQPLAAPYQAALDERDALNDSRGESRSASMPPWLLVISTAGVTALGIWVNRRRARTPVATFSQSRMLCALHQATLERRARADAVPGTHPRR